MFEGICNKQKGKSIYSLTEYLISWAECILEYISYLFIDYLWHLKVESLGKYL